jgi:glycosyltransferase involved in cell wall biosynthesis
LFDYLEADSLLSVDAGIKGQQEWTDRQLTASRPPTGQQLEQYFKEFKSDVVVFIETPFSDLLYPIAHKYGCKVVGIVMHETYMVSRLEADLLICPCETAWKKSRGNRCLMFLPIGLELFPFKLRTGHTFVASIGYGGVHDRRQVAKIVEAFRGLKDPDARLIINSQAALPKGVRLNDRRITLNKTTYPLPKDVYAQGDISIAPMAYGGYERGILESMASGLPCLTVDADPMNLFQHDSDFLLEPCKKWVLNDAWVRNTVYNEVSAEALRRKMEWLLTIPTAEYSRRARKQAEAQSWESGNYKRLWLETLCSI